MAKTTEPIPQSSRTDDALWLTRLIKLGGFFIAIYNAVTVRDPASFAVASFMLAGAQGAENVLKGVKERAR